MKKSLYAFFAAAIVLVSACGKAPEKKDGIDTEAVNKHMEEMTHSFLDAVITMDDEKAAELADSGVVDLYAGYIDMYLHDDLLYVMDYYPEVFGGVSQSIHELVSYELNSVSVDREDGSAIIDVTLYIHDIKNGSKPDSAAIEREVFGFDIHDREAKYKALAERMGKSIDSVRSEYSDAQELNTVFMTEFAPEYRRYFESFISAAADSSQIIDAPTRLYASKRDDGSYVFTSAKSLYN